MSRETLASPGNENLKRMLDYLKISYWLTDLNYVLLDVNQTFLELAGASRENLIGRDMRSLISAEELEIVQNYNDLLGKGKESVQFELYIYGPQRKEKIPVLYHLSLNTDDQGRPVTVNALLMDISEQKKIRDELEKEKKVLQSILFGIRDCVSIFDKSGRFMFGNAESAALHIAPQTPLLPPGSGGPVKIEMPVAGKARQFLGQIRPIYDHAGELFAHAETLTDITDNIHLAERERELLHFKRQVRRDELQTRMIGSGKKMEAVFETVLRCAEVDSSVLIMGETGVGKEVAARSIHAQSHRRGRPFVTVNCGALPETLLESELFGHVKGAFTGATSDRAGLFAEAHAGTLFLDEIGELNKNMQVKLLRVLQEGEVRPVGADRSRKVDVRVICATNRDLQAFAHQGKFRMDLYYRVAVIPLVIPPLRERPQDVLKLADYFIHKHQKKESRDLKTLTLITQQLLRRYHWPGNIRELENAIEHALAMSRAPEITPECFPLQILAPRETEPVELQAAVLQTGSLNRTRRQQKEYQALYQVLSEQEGNLTAAARQLGISRVTLWRRRKKYNL